MANIFTEQMSIFVKIFQGLALYPSNKFLKLYSALSFLTTTVIFISAFTIFPVLQEGNSLSILVGGLVFVGSLATHMMIVFQAYISRQAQADIYQKFDEIDTLLSNQLLMTINYQKIKRRLLIKYLLIVVVLIPIQVISIVSVTFNGLFFNYYVHLIFPVLIIRFRCIQVMFYIDLMREKLLLLNKRIERDVDRKAFDKFQVQKNKIFYVSEKFQINRELKASNASLYDTLLVMKTIYGKIWDIANLCNDCFGYSLLFIVTQYFIEFTSNGYWLFLALESLVEKSIATQSLCSIIPIITLLLSMAYSCYRCTECAQMTGVKVHKIERDINNDIQNALIREFSLQIIHEPIEMSANGFFSINFGLIGGMVASTVTYLVILIQFQLSQKPGGDNSS